MVLADEGEEELVDAGVGGELGWKVAARMWPERTRVGKPSREARVSTAGPARVMRGARMKTISSGGPGSEVGAVRMEESIWRP